MSGFTFLIIGILIGNKMDLAEQRQVSIEEGTELAQKLNMPFFETSAKEKINVAQPFEEICRLIRNHKMENAVYNTNEK